MSPDNDKTAADSPNQPDINNEPAQTPVDQQPGATFGPSSASTVTPTATPESTPQAPVAPQQTVAPEQPFAAGPTPAAPMQPMQGAFPQQAMPPAPKSRKKLFMLAGAAVLVMLAGLAYLFLFFLPSRPDAVFSNGLNRSGKAIDSLVEKATATDNLKKLEKSEMTGSFELETDGQKFNGDLNFKFDPEVINGTASFKAPDSIDVKAEFMAKLLEGSAYPDMFFKISGIEEVAGSMLPQIVKYDDKWISVDSAYLEDVSSSLGYVADSLASTKDEPTAEETAALIKKISNTTNEYVFTDDASKSVLEKREFVGKETTAEGVKSYRYKVAVNKDHAVAYCKALANTVYDDAAFKKLAGDTIDEDSRKTATDSCDDIKDSKDLDKTFDMWMDAKYKIVHKMRFNQDSGNAYVDVGQVYKGGDKLQMFVVYKDEDQKADGKFTIDVDTKQLTTEGNLVVESKGDYAFKLTGKIGVKPYAGDIKFEDPGNATPIQTVLGELGVPATPTGLDGIYGAEPEDTF